MQPHSKAPASWPPPASQTVSTSREDDLAGALHEVSNGLTVVSAWLQHLQEEGASLSQAEVSHALRVAMGRAEHARHLARAAIGAPVAVVSETHSVGHFLRELADEMKPHASRRQISLAVEVEPEVASLEVVESGPCRQILTNLVLNAIAFSPPHGPVQLMAAGKGDDVVFRVQDLGPGVPKAKRAELFSGIQSTRPGGAGIGLNHSALLAKRRGGMLRLEPSDAGARFALRWPAFDLSSGPVSRAPKAQVLQGRRILVVEDDDAVLLLLETALGARGAEIVCARNQREFGEALEGGSFDTALMDLSPVENDVEGSLKSVLHHSPKCSVVVISGSRHHLGGEAENLVGAWVNKPFDLRELMETIAQNQGS